ncbi:MAG: hypothetical protein FWF97_04345 [Alphaproteobacteria bacterium]|nr:hypothetical protein [Alphaproteobacteria bacterium]
MSIKLKMFGGIFAAAFLILPVMAEEIEVVEISDEGEIIEVADIEDILEIAEDEQPAEIREAGVTSREAPAARRTSSVSRASSSSAARVGMIMPSKPAAGAPKEIRAAAVAIPTTVSVAAITEVTPEDLECYGGDKPQGSKCVPCDQKNNPGIRWLEPGKNCKVSQCVSDDYELIDADKDNPKCLQKCAVWGGTASKEWKRDDAEFSFCGSGRFLECEGGFNPTREQTGSSGTEAGRCALDGTMVGKCKTDSQMKPAKFTNGQCMQACENGYWGNCTISKFCEAGFKEGNFRDVIFVKDKKDTRVSVFDCVPL